MTALAIMQYNLRSVRKWTKRIGFKDDDLLLQRDSAIRGRAARSTETVCPSAM